MAGIIRELNKRNVFRVGIAYLVSAWVIAQVASLAADSFEAPGWVMRMIITVLAVGFIPALIFAWAYELTPQGLKRESQVDRSAQPAQGHTARKLDIVVIGLLVVAIGLVAVDRMLPGTSPQPVPQASAGDLSSIAVLPFADFSAARDQAFLGEGIAETLLHALAQVKDLKVSARTSSFAYRDRDVDVSTIGRELGVATVLEGSVQRVGNRLRVVAQLVRTDDHSHLWSLTFDEQADDIFAIQDQIAEQVVATLLGGRADEGASSTRTNVGVYDLYLEGRQLWQQRDTANVNRAVELLEEAVRLDPAYAPARAELATALYFQALYGDTDLEQARERIENELRRALELDAELPQAFATRGLLLSSLRLFDQSGAALLRAQSLSPGDANVQAWLGNHYSDVADFDKAVQHFARAYELDPLNLFVRNRYATAMAGLYPNNPRLERLARESTRLFPDRERAWGTLIHVVSQQGRFDDAILIALEALERFPENTGLHWEVAGLLNTLGEFDASDRWIERIRMLDPEAREWSAFHLARGDAERQLELARQEYAERGVAVIGGLLQALRRLDRLDEAALLVEPVIAELNEDIPDAPVTDAHFAALLHHVWSTRISGDTAGFARASDLTDRQWARVRERGFPDDNVAPELNIAAVRGERETYLSLLPRLHPRHLAWLEWSTRHEPIFTEYGNEPEVQAMLETASQWRQAQIQRLRQTGTPGLFDPSQLPTPGESRRVDSE